MTLPDEDIDRRIRSMAPSHDDSDWRDVRRRARRKVAPLALAVAAVLAIVLAAPAVAFRGELDDLWTRAEPDKNLYVRAIADCGKGTFTLAMDPTAGASVSQKGETLARATMTEREIGCDATIRELKGTPDEAPRYSGTDSRSYEPHAVTCSTERPLEIAVNPIWFENRMVGSTLAVAERGTTHLLASAVLRRDPQTHRNWSAIHWDSRVCSVRR